MSWETAEQTVLAGCFYFFYLLQGQQQRQRAVDGWEWIGRLDE